MPKRFIYSLILATLGLVAKGQPHFNLSGRISNGRSEPVAGATVSILNLDRSVVSDTNGIFEFKGLRKGQYELEVSAAGYATTSREYLSGNEVNQRINVILAASISRLSDVIVTAQKKEENPQQIPFSISTLSRKEVQEYRLWNSRELTAIVPNLYAADPGDQRNVTSIRGIVSSSYDPAVATYIDGVNQFGLDTYIAQLLDIERIEVLRGPQGTLYGRNAMGGVINIITRQPANHINGYAEINIGNYGEQRYNLGFRAPLIKNKLFFGAAGMYEKTNGFYINRYNNSHFDKQHGIAGNYYLKWLAARGWIFMLNTKHQITRNKGQFPLAGSAAQAFAKPFEVDQNAVTTAVDNTWNSSFAVSHSGRSFNFSSQTTYQSNYRYYTKPIDGDFSPLDGITIINNYGKPWNNVQVWTQEFKINSGISASSPLKWTIGAYLFYQKNPVKQATRFGRDATLFGSPDSLYSVINTTKSYRKGMAFYGQSSYQFNPKIDMTVGLRFDYEHLREEVRGQYQHDPDPNPVFDTQPDTSAATHFSALTFKLGLLFHLNDNSNPYVNFSQGYRAGGLTQLGLDPSQPPLYAYKPEYSNNFEVGVKNNYFDNRLRLNLAAFYTIVADAQVPTFILPDAITVTRNTGKLTSKGVELELEATPVRGLEVNYNFGYTHAVFDKLKVSQNGGTVDLAGKRQIFTPEYSSALALQYSYTIANETKTSLIARGEWIGLGQQDFDLANTIKQPSYSLFNARIGLAGKKLGLFIWGRNLGNKKYIAYAYDFGAVHLGNPATYGVTVTLIY